MTRKQREQRRSERLWLAALIGTTILICEVINSAVQAFALAAW